MIAANHYVCNNPVANAKHSWSYIMPLGFVHNPYKPAWVFSVAGIVSVFLYLLYRFRLNLTEVTRRFSRCILVPSLLHP